jgi:putative restriction endonuclease
MDPQQFIDHPDWDKPFFKRLASNDTAAAPGHQGGVVVPKELRRFFPVLLGRISASKPTLEKRICAELYDGPLFLGRVNTRYQYQSWGGERSAESRLTDNLSALRKLATAKDILIIQRNLVGRGVYRLVLVRKSTACYEAISEKVGRRRWGVLGTDEPMSEEDWEEASAKQPQSNAQ